MVRNRTLVSGRFFLIWRVASKLLRPGMPMSINTTSGRPSLALSTASPPLEASPTTSISVSAEISVRMPWRNNVWSSASMIRIFAIFPLELSYSRLFGYRQFYGNLCTLFRAFHAAFRAKLAAQQRHPFPHPGHAKGVALGQGLFYLETDAVVFHAQL